MKRFLGSMLAIIVSWMSSSMLLLADDVDGIVFTGEPVTHVEKLMEGFLGMMPGDCREQEMRIRNASGSDAEIFLSASVVGNDAAMALSGFEMQVEGVPESFTVGGGPVSLGILENGGADIAIQVFIALPLSVGNEFQEAAAEIHWELTAEERTMSVPSEGETEVREQDYIRTEVQDPQGTINTTQVGRHTEVTDVINQEEELQDEVTQIPKAGEVVSKVGVVLVMFGFILGLMHLVRCTSRR